MNIRLTHLDGKLPNLALLKLSSWHKTQGDVVHLSRKVEPELWEPRKALIVEQFVKLYGGRILSYINGNRVPEATKSDLKDLLGTVRAIANDPDGKSAIEAVDYESDGEKTRASIIFQTIEAKQAVDEIESHKLALEHQSDADYQRVLMTFRQSNVKDVSLGKRTGERVMVEDISSKELALVYASDLAEQQIKHEIREADENVFKRGFIVDVNVQMKGGKPAAYRVTNLHQVIDLPDDDEESHSSVNLVGAPRHPSQSETKT
jgi:hypothetical protein